MNRQGHAPTPAKRARILGLPRFKVAPKSKTCGKRKYPSYDVALHAVVKLRRPYPLRIYPCPTCSGWHLTRRTTTWEDR